MESFDILSGPHSGGDAERRIRALKGELYSFNEDEFRAKLKKEGKTEEEINTLAKAEAHRIYKANEAAKGIAMQEEYDKSVASLERTAQRHTDSDQERAA